MTAKKLHARLAQASPGHARCTTANPDQLPNAPDRQRADGAPAIQENPAHLQDFIANLPGMAYQILRNINGDISFPYISEGSLALLGLDPRNLEQNPQLFMNLLHPGDRASYNLSMRVSADTLSFWNWEGRVVLPPEGETKWINLRCTPRKMKHGGVRWEGIMFNINQSKLAEIVTKRAQEQLRELSAHIHDVREQDRLNIAREVHDNLGSILTAIKLNIAWLGSHLNAGLPELSAKTKDIEQLADKCLAAVGNISRSLRPSMLEFFGIIAAVEGEVKEFEQRTGISCTFDHLDDGITLAPDTSIALFRIVQETLTNITKHARASRVKVSIYNLEDCVCLAVSDNGCGLTEADRLKPHSFGLRGIQERVAHFGGAVRIDSSSGGGTAVTVYIPHAAAFPAAGGTPQQILS